MQIPEILSNTLVNIKRVVVEYIKDFNKPTPEVLIKPTGELHCSSSACLLTGPDDKALERIKVLLARQEATGVNILIVEGHHELNVILHDTTLYSAIGDMNITDVVGSLTPSYIDTSVVNLVLNKTHLLTLVLDTDAKLCDVTIYESVSHNIVMSSKIGLITQDI